MEISPISIGWYSVIFWVSSSWHISVFYCRLWRPLESGISPLLCPAPNPLPLILIVQEPQRRPREERLHPIPPHREEEASKNGSAIPASRGPPGCIPHPKHILLWKFLWAWRRQARHWKRRLANHHFRWPQGLFKVGQSLSDLFRNLDLGLRGKSASFLNSLVKKCGPRC